MASHPSAGEASSIAPVEASTDQSSTSPSKADTSRDRQTLFTCSPKRFTELCADQLESVLLPFVVLVIRSRAPASHSLGVVRTSGRAIACGSQDKQRRGHYLVAQ